MWGKNKQTKNQTCCGAAQAWIKVPESYLPLHGKTVFNRQTVYLEINFAGLGPCFSWERASILHRARFNCQNKPCGCEENIFVGGHMMKCSKEYIHLQTGYFKNYLSCSQSGSWEVLNHSKVLKIIVARGIDGVWHHDRLNSQWTKHM